jgi:dolichol-phosphate mannosyltransferase
MARPEISLVIPIFNEEEVLPSLGERLTDLTAQLMTDWEVVFVDDGSHDRSLEMLRAAAAAEARYRVVSFSRNFGHQRAITAGVDAARGKAVVVMDADLQDPPEVVLEMVQKWREGYDVVFGRRRSREGETFFKVLTAKLFYRIFRAMIPIEVPLDTGDFRLMSRRVVMTMRGLRETHRFVRGLVAWAGFRQTAVEYDRAPRAAGTTKYPLRKMISFALDGIASFSVLPLRFATYIGLLVGLVSIIYAIAAVITYAVGATVPGWTTTVVLVSFLFSVQLVMTGVLGEYVGRIYEQVKRRPLYIVAERINFGRKSKSTDADRTLQMPRVHPDVTQPMPQVRAPAPSSEELTSSNLIENVPTPFGMAALPGPPPLPPSTSLKSRPPLPLPSTSSKPPPATVTKQSPVRPPVPSKSQHPPPVAPKPDNAKTAAFPAVTPKVKTTTSEPPPKSDKKPAKEGE